MEWRACCAIVSSSFCLLWFPSLLQLQANPCVEPMYDETIEAPTRFTVELDGAVSESENLHVPKTVESNQTIGAVRNFSRTTNMMELFQEPNNDEIEETVNAMELIQEQNSEQEATTSRKKLKSGNSQVSESSA